MQTTRTPFASHVFVCQATRDDGRPACGDRWDAAAAADAIKAGLKEAGVSVRVSRSGCLGPCAEGPNVMVYPGKVWLQHCRQEDIPAIVDEVVSRSPLAGEGSGS